MIDVHSFKKIKDNIKKLIENGQNEDAQKLLLDYITIFPSDIESYTIEAVLDFINGDFENSEQKLLDIYNKFEFNFDINYNLGIVYMHKGDYNNSLKYLLRAICIDVDKKDMIMNDIEALSESKISSIDFNIIKNKVLNEFKNYQRLFPKKDDENNYVGKFFNINKINYITGVYDNYVPKKDGVLLENIIQLPIVYKTETIRGNICTTYEMNTKCKILIPIMIKNENTKINIIINDKLFTLNDLLINRIYYYSIPKDSNLKIISEQEFILGDIIELKIDKTKPKLLLNIFIDGLSEEFIEKNNFKKIAPNIYKFFNKGTICKNSYVSGEWTYVSLASFFTGTYTTNHKVFHPDYDTSSLFSKQFFSEILQQNEYYTCQINGDWRSTPILGYSKGISRYVYQPAVRGMYVDDVIPETIEHLETFKEKNNFMWIGIPDLHDIADEFETKISTQVINPIETRVFNKTEETSVRKKYDEKKIYKYGTQLKRIDTYLGLLFNYIRDNYREEEYIVSLVADHGQGYLVKSDKFLDEGRTKVAMMFRGKNIPKGTCREMIQGLDLFPIILNAAEVKNVDLKDGNIPKYFGGEKEREFTYTESIFPGSPYRAVINDLEHKFFFDTKENCKVDGRFEIEGYTFKLINKNTEKDETGLYKEKVDKYLKVIFEHIKEYIII